VVDVSDPAHPAAISVYYPEGYSYGLKVKDGFAYLLNSGNDIQIVDVHDPHNLVPRGFIETPGTLKDISIHGDHLYAADFEMGLTIINTSDKDDPFVVKSIPTVGRCINVFTSGNFLFLTAQKAGLEMYDITDPIEPSFLGCYFTDEGIEDIYVENEYAYLTTSTGWVWVVDLSLPSSPLLVGTYQSRDDPGKLMVKEKHIYLCDNRSFKILKFNDPASESRDEFLEDMVYPFELKQNYPNPFNPVTSIQYTVGSMQTKTADDSFAHVTLKIYNILGKVVRTLVDEELSSGKYEIFWDGKNERQEAVASGVYFCKLRVGNLEQTKKMILIR